MASRGKPFRTVVVEGFEVLIGRGDAENDKLTFGFAEPRDFWLHVAGSPGSHVVIRNPDALPELPRSVLEAAAELAAWHSRARRGGKAEVHVCRVADVRKRKGQPPGEVLLKRWEAIRVYPRDREGGSDPEE